MYMIVEVSQYVAVASFSEAWIEIDMEEVQNNLRSSPPSRRRGLKSVIYWCHCSTVPSPPSRRRGLKSNRILVCKNEIWSPPSRRRGLKSTDELYHLPILSSPPSRRRGLKSTSHCKLE